MSESLCRMLRAALFTCAVALIVGNWAYLCTTRPKILWTGFLETAAVQQQYGVLVAVVLLAAASIIGETSWRDLALMFFGVLIDIVVGRLIFATAIPLYLDTIGSVFAAVLLGPRHGAIVAGLVSLLLYPVAPALLPLAVVNITVAVLAGLFARFGGFSGFWPITLNALFTGLVAAMVSAPMSLYLAATYTTNNEEVHYMVGKNLIGALFGPPFGGGSPSDLLDKLLVFWLVYWLIRALFRTPVLPTTKQPALN